MPFNVGGQDREGEKEKHLSDFRIECLKRLSNKIKKSFSSYEIQNI